MARFFVSQKTQYFVKCDRLLDQVEADLKDLYFDIILALPANISECLIVSLLGSLNELYDLDY